MSNPMPNVPGTPNADPVPLMAGRPRPDISADRGQASTAVVADRASSGTISSAPIAPSAARGESDALIRRTRYTLRTAILLIAAAAALAAALILSARSNARFDFTATREHTLSPRTLGILKSLDEPTAIVVSADVSRTDPRSWERVTDMLKEFERQSPNARVTIIDSARPEAAERAAAVVGELATRDWSTVENQLKVMQTIEQGLERISPDLARAAATISDRANAAQDTVAREKLLQAAAALRVASKDAADAAVAVRAARDSGPEVRISAEQRKLPETDNATRAAGPVIAAALKVLKDESQAGLAAALGNSLAPLRDTLAVLADELRNLRPVDALTIARAVRERPVVLVYSSRGTNAIDFDTLFPRSAAATQPGAAQPTTTPLFVGEELLGSALVSLKVERRPVLVLVHAERERLLDDTGRPTSNTANAIGKLLDRLNLRKVDIAEWPVALDPARPPLARQDPTNQRPKVWFVMPAPARTSADPRGSRGGAANPLADRSERVARLGTALQTLLDAGENVLLALEPSELPAVGEPDPITIPLKSWGIKPDTARPLMERLGTQRGPAISLYQTLRNSEPGTPIADALRGLSLILHWPMAIQLDTPLPTGVRATPVFTVGTAANTATDAATLWGESSWLPLRYANVRQPFQALMPPELPKPEPARDLVGGPFPVIVAAERDRTTAGTATLSPQRLLIVSAPGWFEDLYTQAAATVDGRRVWAFPGNAELFEAGLHWLANLDELIAGSPRIRDVPRIEPMTDARLSALRWTLIAGFPLAVLALGFAVRVLRG
ncbi:MAG: Gldg family protein [Phycisphaerales bacterium]